MLNVNVLEAVQSEQKCAVWCRTNEDVLKFIDMIESLDEEYYGCALNWNVYKKKKLVTFFVDNETVMWARRETYDKHKHHSEQKGYTHYEMTPQTDAELFWSNVKKQST